MLVVVWGVSGPVTLTMLQILSDFIAISEGNTRFSMWTLMGCFALNIVLGLIMQPGAPDGITGPIQPIAFLYYLLFAGYAGGGYALWAKQERAREPVVQPGVQQPAV